LWASQLGYAGCAYLHICSCLPARGDGAVSAVSPSARVCMREWVALGREDMVVGRRRWWWGCITPPRGRAMGPSQWCRPQLMYARGNGWCWARKTWWWAEGVGAGAASLRLGFERWGRVVLSSRMREGMGGAGLGRCGGGPKELVVGLHHPTSCLSEGGGGLRHSHSWYKKNDVF